MLNTIHKSLAVLIILFVAAHLINHVVGLNGIEEHVAFMELLRKAYKNPVIETILLSAIALQLLIGFWFVARSWGSRHGFFQRAQAISGIYLGLFLLAHVSAVFTARYQFELDTNFYFAAAGMHIANLKYGFVPYYFFGVLAIFIHIACFLYGYFSNKVSNVVAFHVGVGVIVIGAVTSTLLVMMLAGALYDVGIPREYNAFFTELG